MVRRNKWLSLVALLLLSPLVLCVLLGLLPASADPVLPPEAIVVGAPSAEEGDTAALEFPPLAEPEDNVSTPEKVHLGYMLFFDPILSENNDIACATCHHPDLGFADGRRVSMGAGGAGLGPTRVGGEAVARNAPSLYEVAYREHLFWDGRATDLEEQVETPLTLATEMHADLDETVAEVAGIGAYRALFDAAFPAEEEPITYENIARALASFQRTLIAHDSPFDRYARGETSALTPSQRRGFALFRSAATGCYRCHAAPLFTSETFEVIGVPGASGGLDPDSGRGAVTGEAGEEHAFRVPTLRNVALTAPYMHNGVFDTLEEVIAFYAGGGGRGIGFDVPGQARAVRPFDLSEQETADLIDFLYALTDESSSPGIPESVPSGLPVVPPMDNPGRALSAEKNSGSRGDIERPITTLTVSPGQTIQSVVDTARPGDTIEIEYGTYHERIVIDIDSITVRGIPNEEGEWPILDGRMEFADGIAASGDNFTLERIQIKNYNGNGVIVDGATGVILRDLYIENTSLYGAYPVHSTSVLVERVEATGIRDAGVYAGQCRDVILRDNVVYGNVIGIEIENSINSELYNNHAYDNSTGIFVDLLPQLASKVSLETRVYNNVVEDNNLANFAREGEIGSLVPPGTGILVLGGDDVEIHDNEIRNHRTVGVAIFSTATAFDETDLDIGPNPERVHVYSNRYENNGWDPAEQLRELGIPGSDVIWDASNWDIRVDEEGISSFPPLLPGSRWPDVVKRGYWQALNFLINNLL